MTIQSIEDIRNKIANDNLKEAIEFFRVSCVEFSDELIIQSNKFKRLRSDIRKGIISREQSNLERNILCNSLLELLNEVDVKETKPKNKEHQLNEELRDILGLAELISRRKGKLRTSTKDFFAALVTMKPTTLQGIIKELTSKKALPKPVNKDWLNLPRRLSNNRVLSGCLTKSLKVLGERSVASKRITPADMFIDVTRYGKGKSVAKLRKKGVGEAVIDDYVSKFEIEIQRRKESE